MKIALDYDDTYTLAPGFWNTFIEKCRACKFDIRIVTARHAVLDDLGWMGIPVIYTNGVAKAWWCHHYEDFDPHVWIDDKPQGILNNSDKSKEWLEEWRATREG